MPRCIKDWIPHSAARWHQWWCRLGDAVIYGDLDVYEALCSSCISLEEAACVPSQFWTVVVCLADKRMWCMLICGVGGWLVGWGGHQTWENKNRSVGLLGCHGCVCLSTRLPLQWLPSSQLLSCSFPIRRPLKTYITCHSTWKRWTKPPPTYFTELNPILLFHCGLLSTQPHLISSLWCDKAR